MITFTQGDYAVLNLTATDGDGNPINITGGSFTTLINGPNGSPVNMFPNGQHVIVDGPNGQFTLTLQPEDTGNCGLGLHKEILTQIVIGGDPITYRGINTLTVYAPVPFQ